jgi:hypothetical protein
MRSTVTAEGFPEMVRRLYFASTPTPHFSTAHPIHQRQSFRAELINFVANSDSLEEGLGKTLIMVV